MLSKRVILLGLPLLAILLAATVFPFSVSRADPPDTATVLFGDPDAGSLGKCKGQGGKKDSDGENTPCGNRGHDESQEAADKLVPRTVAISAGGTVTFESNGVHQPSVFPPGTDPADVPNTPGTRTGFGGCPGGAGGNRYITEGTELADPVCAGGPAQVVSPAGTFAAPGKYLVICAFQGHFFNRDMYGWVDVK